MQPSNTKTRNVKSSLKNRELTIGSWITLAHPAIAEIMAKAGFDWLVVDLEHSTINIREAEELIRVIDLSGSTPLVRLTSNNSDLIKRIMDAGAHGIIVPMVNSPEDARKAIASVNYPPLGQRGVGLARAQGYGTAFKEYHDWLGQDAIVVVQIEHIDAVRNLEAIFSVDGVDGYIVGPYDLSGSMNMPGQFDHPDFLEAMEEIRNVSETMNMPGGMHIIEPDSAQLKQHISDGYRFIAYSLDFRMLDVTCRSGLESIEALRGL